MKQCIVKHTIIFFLIILLFILVACSRHPVVTDLLQTDFTVQQNEEYCFRVYSKNIYPDPWSKRTHIVKVAYDVDVTKMWSKTTRSVMLAASHNSSARVIFPLQHSKGRLSFDCASLGKGRLTIQLLSPAKKEIIGQFSPPPLPFTTVTYDITNTISNATLVMEYYSDSTEPSYCFIANATIQHEVLNTKPNIIFISVDALRADAVSCIVPRFAITPNLDKLAADGVAFTKHFVVANWTRPSTVAMLASMYGSSTGVNIYYFQVSNQEKKYFYNESGTLPLPVLFKKHGYITRSIGNNAFILDHSGIGVDLGFDNLSDYQRQWEDTMDIAAEAIEWIHAHKDKPFFLFLNFNAPHNAYIPPKQYLEPLRKTIKGVHPWFRRYLGEVAYTDDYIGRVVAALKKLNLYDTTIIVVTSDHGEVFNTAHEHSPYTGKKSIFTHGQTLFDEEIHVPLIIKLPKGFNAIHKKISYQVRNVDIAPTVCELAGISIPQVFQGKSLLPFIEGSEHADRPLYCEGRLMYGVRWDNFKYIEKFYGFGVKPHHWGGAVVDEYKELYDCSKDPEELHNLINTDNKKAQQMQQMLYTLRFTQPENVLYAKMDVSGTISVREGFFYTMESEGAVQKINRQLYRFTLKKGEKILFSSIPAYTVYYINPDHGAVLWGVGGVILPKVGSEFTFDTTVKALQQNPDQAALQVVPDVLLVWSNGQKGGIQKVTEKVAISDEMNTLLKQWGYIQNGGTR